MTHQPVPSAPVEFGNLDFATHRFSPRREHETDWCETSYFVQPDPGPVLANYGLDNLRFLKPVSPGDAISVRLTVKQKTAARKPEYGEVHWDVEVRNQLGETVATYDLLTMNARPHPAPPDTAARGPRPSPFLWT